MKIIHGAERITVVTASLALALGVAAAIVMPAIAADDAYERGMDALDGKQWREAAARFDEVIAGGGKRTAAALYWKAQALGKLGRIDDALATLDRLRREHPRSNWIEEARALEVELRAGAAPISAEQLQAETKLIALDSLMYADPARAVPQLKKFLASDQSPELRERALFVLVQSGSPEALEVLGDLARDGSDPVLQSAAITHLGIVGGRESFRVLGDVYQDSSDSELKGRILQSFMIAGEEQRIIEAARNERSAELRAEAIGLLGVMRATGELAELYDDEPSTEIKEAILQSFMVAGDRERVVDVATDETSDALRGQAVQLLGVMGAAGELERLYEREPSDEVKGAILQAYMIAGDKQRVLRAARGERSAELREQSIQLLGVMDAGEELWQLFQDETSPELRESILQSLFIAGDVDRLAEVARGDDDARVRAAAIQALGLAGGRRTAELLTSLYATESDREIRSAILQALFIQGNVKALIDIARDESDPQLKAEAVRSLAMMDSDEATDYMMEILDE